MEGQSVNYNSVFTICVYLFSQERNDSLSVLIVAAVFYNWRDMSPAVKKMIFNEFKTKIENFEMPFFLVPRSLDTLYQMKSEETKLWCVKLKEVIKYFVLLLL